MLMSINNINKNCITFFLFFSHTAERHTQTKKSVSLRLKRDDDIEDKHLGMCLCQAVAVNISVYKYTQMSTAETH